MQVEKLKNGKFFLCETAGKGYRAKLKEGGTFLVGPGSFIEANADKLLTFDTADEANAALGIKAVEETETDLANAPTV